MSVILPNVIASGPLGGGEANTVAKWTGDDGGLDYLSQVKIDYNSSTLDIECKDATTVGVKIIGAASHAENLFEINGFGGSGGDYLKIGKNGNVINIKADPSILNSSTNIILGGGGAGLTHGAASEGWSNTGFGDRALSIGVTTTIYKVSAFGAQAAYLNIGHSVTATGYQSAFQNSGINVSAFGSGAAFNGTADNVCAFGVGSSNQGSGDDFSGFGHYTGFMNSGDRVSAFGYYAGFLGSGDDCIYIGNEAGNSNSTNNQFILKQSTVNAVPLIQGDFNTGYVGIGLIDADSQLEIYSSGIAVTTLHLKSFASQTADIINITDSSDVTITKIQCDGSLKLPYLGASPSNLENGLIWMESDGLHLYYNDAEKTVAGV